MAGGNNYGPRLDNRQRGNATQLLEKYRALARDAQQAGDRVTAEYYLQYAEHYYRVLGDYRDRQPEGRNDGRRGRDSFDDDTLDADMDGADAGDDEAGDEGEAGESRDSRPNDRRERRDNRPRDDRQRDERPREDRQRDDRPRDSRQRDDRPRDYQRDDRNRDDRARDERSRDDRPAEERGSDDRGQDRRRDWQRDRRDRRPERAERQDQRVDQDGGDDRESLLQALPPPATMPAAETGGRRLGLKRERAEVVDAPAAEPVVEAAAAAETESAPKRRGRPRKVAEPAAE
jgi:hypothetical protein